jgi:uncharacterized protein
MSENIQVICRHVLSRLPAITGHHLVMLTGARQTGKTTVAKQSYSSLPYFNLDAVEYRRQLAGVSSFSWGKTVGNAVLDEVQKEPSLFEKVKFAFDEQAISFSVLLGSAQLLLLKKIKETLAGRVLIYELWPLLFSELVSGENKPPLPLIAKMLQTGEVENLCKRETPRIFGPQAEHLHSTENYLCQWGGMPGLLHLNDDLRWQWLKSYEQSYLERDLEDMVRLHDLEPFRTFHRLAALRSGSLLSFSELARDAALSVETARRYIEYLKISYQTFLLQPYTRNLTSSLVKTPKLYWTDMGLWRQLTGTREGLSGQAFENFIVSEILKLAKTLDLKAEFSFYRTRSGMEIDLFCKTNNGVLGMEIKSRDTIASSDYSNLCAVAKALGKEWLGGLVIYRGDEIRNLTDSIWAMPSTRLLS